MASPQIFDIEELLQPIEGDSESGIDLRENASADYYTVKDARSAARAAERSMDVEDDAGGLLPEWRTILEVSPRILRTQAKDLEVTAWADDGEIMGFQHRTRPIHGVQFHPESIATEGGHGMLANFLDLAGVKRLAAA